MRAADICFCFDVVPSVDDSETSLVVVDAALEVDDGLDDGIATVFVVATATACNGFSLFVCVEGEAVSASDADDVVEDAELADDAVAANAVAKAVSLFERRCLMGCALADELTSPTRTSRLSTT